MAATLGRQIPRFSSFEEFFPYYVGQHSKAGTRWLHFTGTNLAFILGCFALGTRRWGLLIAAPLVGYAIAWVSHFAVEGNRPATFGHPAWSLRGDMRILRLMWQGRDAELAALGRAAQAASAAGAVPSVELGNRLLEGQDRGKEVAQPFDARQDVVRGE